MTGIFVLATVDNFGEDDATVGVFSSQQQAQAAAQVYLDTEITEFEVDGVVEHPAGLLPFLVVVDGESYQAQRTGLDKMRDLWAPDSRGRVSGFVWARDDSHAVEVARQRRAELETQGEWFTDPVEFYARQVTP